MTKTMITSDEAFSKIKKLDKQILAAIKDHFSNGYANVGDSKCIYITEEYDCYINESRIDFIMLDKKDKLYVNFIPFGLEAIILGTHSSADLATILSAIEKTKS